MARKRINKNAICSSYNYKVTKKLHVELVTEKHKEFEEKIRRKEIIIKKQAYVKCFGNLVPISDKDVERLINDVTIIWK